MTPDERTALNEAVCKRLGWESETRRVLHKAYDHTFWKPPGHDRFDQWERPDFTSDWNAVYRWIVPAVIEMEAGERELFVDEMMTFVAERINDDWPDFLDATPEDYCRAFLKVTK